MFVIFAQLFLLFYKTKYKIVEKIEAIKMVLNVKLSKHEIKMCTYIFLFCFEDIQKLRVHMNMYDIQITLTCLCLYEVDMFLIGC